MKARTDNLVRHKAPRRLRLPSCIAASLFALASGVSLAESLPVFTIGFDKGGDDIREVEFDDGDKESVTAGDGIYVEAALRGDWLAGIAKGVETDVSVGYKFDSVKASNGDLSFSRFTVSAVPYIPLKEKFRVGAGVTYHLNVTYKEDTPTSIGGGDIEADADNALGFLIAADYTVNEYLTVGLRATQISYDFSDENGDDDVDGASVGLNVSYRYIR